MGENLNLMQALYVTILSMAMVFLILLIISGVLSLFKYVFKNENTVSVPNVNNIDENSVNNIDENSVNNIQNNNVEDSFEIDEEEKIVVALAASIMAGDSIPNPNLHIKRITRIS